MIFRKKNKVLKNIKGIYRIYSDKYGYGYMEIENVNRFVPFPINITYNPIVNVSIFQDSCEYCNCIGDLEGPLILKNDEDSSLIPKSSISIIANNLHDDKSCRVTYIDVFLYKNIITHAIFYEKYFDENYQKVNDIDISVLSKFKN
ncbi:hypothetical protein [Flavobacterium sp.]|uniref:hypothetical protein n=1 Tax=Flavobacterium sp. TaxID=239 RepID=UPI003F69D41C